MNALFSSVARWLGFGGALADNRGQQVALPGTALVEDTPLIGPDGALQVSTVWRCVALISTMIGSLPCFVYRARDGARELARDAQLWSLLHDSPNKRMTPSEFWTALLVNWLLRGNAYARIERNELGNAVALWPMAADQVTPYVLDNGDVAYLYRFESEQWALTSEQVLHIKDIGNGTVGLSKLEYMRATTAEVARAQSQATKTFANGNKPTGILTVDRVLNDEQRAALRRNFADIAEGSSARLYVLEAAMKYDQVSLTPAEVQLLETRRFGIEEVCRWFGVPPVLVGHSNVTTWGTGVEQIIDGFYKVTIRPMLVALEQALAKRVLTPVQRARFTVEFNFDALLRGSAKERFDLYASGVQNGVITRNEARQLENLPPMAGGNELTAQINLAPITMLGKLPEKPAEPAQPAPNDDETDANEAEKRENKAREERLEGHRQLLALVASAQRQTIPSLNFTLPELKLEMPDVYITNQAPNAPDVHYEMRMEAPTMPTIQNLIQVNPTPVQVDAHFEATVEPAEVRLELPPRRTDTTVSRDRDGNIVKAVQIEKDA